MEKCYYVYMATNNARKPIYTGVTSDIAKRAYEHKNGVIKSFTKKYNLKKLVYVEAYRDVETAIRREKLIKKWRREIKFEAIEKMNPNWEDLYDRLNC